LAINEPAIASFTNNAQILFRLIPFKMVNTLFFFGKSPKTSFFLSQPCVTFAVDLKKGYPNMDVKMFQKLFITLIFSGLSVLSIAQGQGDPGTKTGSEPTSQPDTQVDQAKDGDGADAEEHEFNAGENAVHHISDGNAINIIGDIYLHLPVILYEPKKGWTFTTTASFHPHHHGDGTMAYHGYTMAHGNVVRFVDASMAEGHHEIEKINHEDITADGKTKTVYSAMIGGKSYELEPKSSYDGGILGGGITNFYDFSITRNVFTMLLTCLILFFVFRSVANSATKRRGQAPRGLQNFIEPFVTFIRDEVAKPNIGPKYEKYMPYLLTAFFFILGLNLIGQIPFFPGSANVTGNISITIVLALITFIISTFSANKHFWEHTLWMPGVPAVLKILILTPIEILGVFLKPFTLLLRLFANITAGHIVILSFVSLIFILGKSGASTGGSIAGIAASVPLTLFMMTLELLVAFLQAFIFTMLSASYIGAAVEEPHHH
jgi:F-type H+-transporting ATPase subunit a